jgi:hypothetical protein
MYIDFECRQKQRPTLLGVLGGANSAQEGFEQWILDSALASAKVASPAAKVDELTNVAKRLTDEADRHHRSIIGWSLFDRDRIVDDPKVSSDAKAIIIDRYTNAITVAKQWRHACFRDWDLEANDLKSYFKPTGFTPRLRLTAGPTPADWIDHVQNQIASRGSYAHVTQQTKRDWHYLLAYNEDDCRGLKHVFDTATRELSLWRAYAATTFRVDASPDPIDIRIGWRRKHLEKLLNAHRAMSWAFVTAWNPRSQPQSDAENQRRHRSLIGEVERANLAWLPGRGIGADDGWPPQESLFILGCSEAKALALGRQFAQLAICVGRSGEPARLVSCKVTPVVKPT